MAQVDLNIDLGELPGEPAELFALATVANLACGGHAGDRASMARAVSFALTRGTRLAAHPSYPDRAGFGRVTMAMAPFDLAAAIEQQCAALQGVARKLGYPVASVKPHGALYHDAATRPEIAGAVLDGAARGLGVPAAELTVIGPPPSNVGAALLEAALRLGAHYAREGFANRAYRPDGTLVPRGEAGALITDPGACARQALSLASGGALETICVHGDSPGAVAIAGRVRDALAQAGLLRGAV